MRQLLTHGSAWGLALAQEAPTVRPERWPQAGRWPAPAWAVIGLGALLAVLVVVFLVRRLRPRRR